jgi:hypothetical protein
MTVAYFGRLLVMFFSLDFFFFYDVIMFGLL